MRPTERAYCGINCESCNVLKATLTGDEDSRKLALQEWQETAEKHWGMEVLDPNVLSCRGCRTTGEDIFRGCRFCPIRNCCIGRGLVSCALCGEWQTCARLNELGPEARDSLALMQ